MQKYLSRSTNLGFTLAEVLITLGIIGIVAALTIPTIINNSQKIQYVAQLQKMTSTLNNGFKQIMANAGCSDFPCTGILTASMDTTADNIQSARVFNILKVCHINQTGCHDNMVYLLRGSAAWIPAQNYSTIIFNDGSMLGLSNPDPNCNQNVGNNQYSTACGWAIIDVNGAKPPNIFGRDLYRFYLSRYGVLLPVGAADATVTFGHWDSGMGTFSCGVYATGSGETCFGRIVEQGWQMNY